MSTARAGVPAYHVQCPAGSGGLCLSQQEACFPPHGPSPAPRPLLLYASYLYVWCLENVILSSQGCELLWEQGEFCCGSWEAPRAWIQSSELVKAEETPGDQPAPPDAHPQAHQPTSTSTEGVEICSFDRMRCSPTPQLPAPALF